VLFISCGGGSGSSTQTPTTNTEGDNDPTVGVTPDENDTPDIPASGPPIDDGPNLILGPLYGEELSLYHANLVMKVLRLIGFVESSRFVGQPVGRVVNGITDYYKDFGRGDDMVTNGALVPCFHGDETYGTKSVTWDNGGGTYPAQYSNTRIYHDCRHGGMHFGLFNVYDGTVIQSGIASDESWPHAIRYGNIHVEDLKLTDHDLDDISITLDGYMSFSEDDYRPYALEISEIALDIREVNYSASDSISYIENITVHDGTVTFEELVHEDAEGTNFITGVKEASFKISVENSNHGKIELLVTTVTPENSDTVYSLMIARGGNTVDAVSMDHTIRIDRFDPPVTTSEVFNVSIDFNHNGVIDGPPAYPQEYYEGESLFRDRWGFMSGL
jgi:hypothetical protein